MEHNSDENGFIDFSDFLIEEKNTQIATPPNYDSSIDKESLQSQGDVLVVEKKFANFARDLIKKLGWQGQEGLLPLKNHVLIPLNRNFSIDDSNLQSSLASIGVEHFFLCNSNLMQQKIHKKYVPPSPSQLIHQFLSSVGMKEDLLQLLPTKWEKIGHIVILKKLDEKLKGFRESIGEAFLKAIVDCKTVCVDEGGIQGELREPEITIIKTLIETNPTLTTHIENNIKYGFDVSKCMFSSGNGTERMYFSNLKCSEEIIVDMFAGIGYFSLPLALHSGAALVVSIEKNPNSNAFLKRNLTLNGIPMFPDQIHSRKPSPLLPILGDNRIVGKQYEGKAHRVLMGYIPTPTSFLQQAFLFLREEGGIIHYHHNCTKKEFKLLAIEHLTVELAKHNAQFKTSKEFDLIDFRVIKSYSPQVFHCSADFKISAPKEFINSDEPKKSTT